MKFYYAGSNVYGQIINAGPEIVDSFTCHEDHNFRELVDSGHFCSLFRHCDGNLHLYGAANQKTFQTLELEDTKDVSQARALDDKVMLLKANGDLFKIDLEDTSSRVKLPNFTRVESADHSDQLVQLAFSRTMNVLLTSNNNLFNLSSRLDVKQESISDFRTGIEHCLVLTESGNIYTFGQGSRGQLGHGILDNESEPRLVEALSGIRITKIAASGWHSCALSADRDLYTWGWNSNGQLGLKDVSVMATPHIVDVIKEGTQINVVDVACGHRHTVILTDDNALYGMGWNKYGQLGSKVQSESNEAPVFLRKFHEIVLKLDCAPWGTIVSIKL